ncbi:MAG: hypothetical protein WC308_02735 [archaeon]
MTQKIEILKQIEAQLKETLPDRCEVSKIEMEGPEVVIYTKNPAAFFGADNFVSKTAFALKKRINIRTDKSLLGPEEQAKKQILEMVPKEADVKDVYFNEPFSQVVIEAVKKGIVIGKGGEISKK